MATWSLDSLPSVGPLEPQNEENNELVKHSLSELTGKTAKSLVVVLTQPDLSSSNLRSLGFRAVKSSWHYSPDFFRSRKCPPAVRAIVVVQVGLEMTEQGISCIDALSRNTSSPAIIMVLMVPDGGTRSQSELPTFAWGDSMRQAQEQCFENGADDVITLRLSETLVANRLWEAVHRAEINAQKFEGMAQTLADIKNKATIEVNRVKELACRKMQVAWKEVMWNLPGTTLAHIPVENSSILERQPNAVDSGGVGDYEFTCKLGRGSFGTVVHAYKNEDGEKKPFAIKIIKKSAVKSVGELFALDQEIATLMHLTAHPNIARAHQVLHTASCIYLIMDYAGAMNLHTFAQAQLSKTNGAKSLPESMVLHFIKQMALAVAHMHMSMICHRDLKPTNCIVSDSPDRKLCIIDFGLAAVLCGKQELLTQCCGSLPFCAPEVLRQETDGTGYNPFAADVWSVAGNFIELAFGPYSLERMLGWVPQHPTDQRKMVVDLAQLAKTWPSAPDTKIAGLNALIGSMMQLNPTDRISMEQVLRPESGLGLVVPQPPPRNSRILSLANKSANIISRRGLEVREVKDVDAPDTSTKPLFERIHGAPTISKAVEEMLDEVLCNSPSGLVLQRNNNNLPAIRALYVEALSTLYQASPGNTTALASLYKEGKDLHAWWHFSDSNFDDLVKYYEQALTNIGICEAYKKEAMRMFRHIRVPATYVFQSGYVLEERSFQAIIKFDINEPVDPTELFDRTLNGQKRNFEGLEIASATADISRISGGVVRASLDLFLGTPNGDIMDRTPLLLRDSKLSYEQAAELIENIVTACEQARILPNREVSELDIAMRWELERYRLQLAMQDIREMREKAARHHVPGASDSRRNGGCFWALDPVLWFSVLLHLQALMAVHVPEARRSDNAHCIGRIGGVLAAGAQAPGGGSTPQSQESEEFSKRLLAVRARERGFTHADLDLILDHLPRACGDAQLPEAVAEKVAEAISAMRPFILRGVQEFV